MSTGKRLAKRSILGTRVCVPGQDGRYYPAVIQATKTTGEGFGENIYCVIFDNRTTKEFREREIVGPGFQSVSGRILKPEQRCFVTNNGREVAGVVISHRPEQDEVIISIGLGPIGPNGPNGQLIEVVKRLEEVRLMESRKSARLLDLDQDYSRLADLGPHESRKRPTSSGIDVPIAHGHGNRKRRPSSSDDVDVLDDCAAAMVLMSLSCSPKSPRLPGYFNDSGAFFSHSWTESSSTSSSGASSWQGAATSDQPRNGTPSPPNPHGLSKSAPDCVSTLSTGSPSSLQDEGIDMEDESLDPLDDFLPRKRRNSTRTVFQCTWKGCKVVTSTCEAIEKHVRLQHLNRPESDEGNLSDHEEEFYYAEVEVSADSVADSLASMHTSSPPTLSHMDMARPPYEDPEYQRLLQTAPRNAPTAIGSCMQMPITIRQQVPWQQPQTPVPLSPQKQPKLGVRMLSSSPKPSSLRHRKCRKVYGMENRDLWCTQCKWKKACTRFGDIGIPVQPI